MEPSKKQDKSHVNKIIKFLDSKLDAFLFGNVVRDLESLLSRNRHYLRRNNLYRRYQEAIDNVYSKENVSPLVIEYLIELRDGRRIHPEALHSLVAISKEIYQKKENIVQVYLKDAMESKRK